MSNQLQAFLGQALGSFVIILLLSSFYNETTRKIKNNMFKMGLIKFLILGIISVGISSIFGMKIQQQIFYIIWISVFCIVDFIRDFIKTKNIDPVEIDKIAAPIHTQIPIESNEVEINEYKEKPVVKAKKSFVFILLIVLIILNYALVLGVVFYQKGINENLEKQTVTSNGTITYLKNQVKEQLNKISVLETEINKLSTTVVENNDNKLSLSIDNLNHYSIMTSEYGSFLMYIEKAEEYLTGYKLTVMFGNTMDATYLDTKFHFVFPKAGSVSQRFKIHRELNIYNYDDYKHYTHDESKAISNGSWTRMVVYIPDITLDELKSFYVIPEISNVFLNY